MKKLEDRPAPGSQGPGATLERGGGAVSPLPEPPLGVSVLLVEDNPGDARLVREMLAEPGDDRFDVTWVERISAAEQQLHEAPFDVVLLDLVLPDAAGLGALARIRTAVPHVPVVVLTGLADNVLGLKAVGSGADDYLIKGRWDAGLLARAIRYAIFRRKAQESLARSETLLALGDFALWAGHNLRNLFMVIRGRLSLLLESHDKAEIQKGLRLLLDATDRGTEIVRRLHAFTQAEPLAEVAPVDLNEVAKHVLELTRPQWDGTAKRGGGRIEPVLELGDIPPVLGDSFALHEVLMNLMFNAIEALPAGGRLGIKTWVSDQRVYCSVWDAGVGMSEQVRRRAVEPFFTTKDPKRTGLGLSVAYGILKRHFGELALESVEGQGSQVTLSLPLSPLGLRRP